MKKIAFSGLMASILMTPGLALADAATLTTKDYVDTGLKTLYQRVDAKKADATNVYTKSETDAALENVYTKNEADAAFLTSASIEGKADANNVYTKAETDAALENVYTKAETDAALENVYTKEAAENKFATKDELGGIEIETYSAAENGGLTIDENNQFALNIPEPAHNTMYVYKDGKWEPLEVDGTFPTNYNFAAQ